MHCVVLATLAWKESYEVCSHRTLETHWHLALERCLENRDNRSLPRNVHWCQDLDFDTNRHGQLEVFRNSLNAHLRLSLCVNPIPTDSLHCSWILESSVPPLWIKIVSLLKPALPACAKHRIPNECMCLIENLNICMNITSFIHIKGLDLHATISNECIWVTRGNINNWIQQNN